MRNNQINLTFVQSIYDNLYKYFVNGLNLTNQQKSEIPALDIYPGKILATRSNKFRIIESIYDSFNT